MTCPHCGEKTHSGRIYCPNCGGRLVPLDEGGRKGQGGGKRAVAVILVIAILAGGVFFGARMLKNRGGGGQPGPVSRPTDTTAPTRAPTVTAVPTQAPAATTAPRISTRGELVEAMKQLIKAGGTQIDNIALTESEINTVVEDFGYYYDSYTTSYLNISGPYDISFVLSPSRRAWKAWRDGGEAGLDAEAGRLLDRARAAVSGVISPGMTDYDKELALHDYIINHCEYMIDVENRHTGDARGFFDYGMCQCAGYADTFWLLGTMAGLEVEIINGDALKLDPELAARFHIETNGHAWNLVKLNGLWYGLDVTWDDPVGDKPTVAYTFFNLPAPYLAKSRAWNRALDPAGAYAQTIDDNYYLYRLYNRPEYRAANASEGLQSALRQIAARGEAYVAFTNKNNILADVKTVSTGLAEQYRKTSWYVDVIGPQSEIAAYLPFYVYRFYFED